MTRLPETPDQQENKSRHHALVRYLMTLSEERQVMFMRNLKSNRFKLELTRDLERMKATRDKLVPPKDIGRYRKNQ